MCIELRTNFDPHFGKIDRQKMYFEEVFQKQIQIYHINFTFSQVAPEQLNPYAVVVPTMATEGQDEEKKPLDGPIVTAYPTSGKNICRFWLWKQNFDGLTVSKCNQYSCFKLMLFLRFCFQTWLRVTCMFRRLWWQQAALPHTMLWT